MRLPRGRDVPVTAGVSGIVLVLVMYFLGGTTTWLEESLVLGSWALLYLAEWAVRSRRGSRAPR